MNNQLSKSEKKRRAKGIEQLVTELAALTQGEIAVLPCDQEIRNEIAAAGGLKGSARTRQIKYAAKLLRDIPVEDLYDFLARKKGSMLKEKRTFHELEHMRNLLVDEVVQRYDEEKHSGGFIRENEPVKFLDNSEAMGMIVEQLPDVDQTLLKNTAIQFARTRKRKFSRELFRILKAALEKAQFSKESG